jgi:3',5'-cyclic AMP phosphodiesterase CpdA
MFRLIQISDTHLSRNKPHITDNWAPLVAWITATQPDLVIHTGDVTIDGADTEDDLRLCAELMRGLGVRFRALPGNHDVGDAGHRHQPVNPARLARWHRYFGPDRWFEDVEGWGLIGLDALLFGSGQAEERAQLAWLEAVMNEAKDRRLGWFVHRPLFLESPQEGDTGYWSVKPAPRRALLKLLCEFEVALVGSGHLHKAHQFMCDGTRYVWGPSSAFLGGPEIIPEMPGEKRLGAVLYEIHGTELRQHLSDVRSIRSTSTPARAADRAGGAQHNPPMAPDPAGFALATPALGLRCCLSRRL